MHPISAPFVVRALVPWATVTGPGFADPPRNRTLEEGSNHGECCTAKRARSCRAQFSTNRLTRLKSRLNDPEWRRFGYLLLAGKALGVAFLLVSIFGISSFIGAELRADDAAAAPVLAGNDIVNPINTVWTLVAAFLVFGMQAGFTFLEAGFCRSRETVNVLMECVVDTCL
jgi:Amt family ammonium transporter